MELTNLLNTASLRASSLFWFSVLSTLLPLLLEKFFCGWACPFGLVQDFLSYLPFKKERVSSETHKSMKDIKWAIIGFSVLVCVLVGFRRLTSPKENPVGVFSDSPFSVLSPSGTLFAYIPWMLLWNQNVLATAGLFGWIKFALLVGSLVPSLYIPRFFCRYVCPMGGLLDPLSSYKVLRIKFKETKDRAYLNEKLNEVCPMGVQVTDNEVGTAGSNTIESAACIHCGKCVTQYPRIFNQEASITE
eukprot:TRINITY_DN888_c0_g1_i2.p1 TRINITY_DN888_c0_g1~~TRINITY_DN888_c0_g1_i2.p1  ORF type:complete len:246 (-),score=28.31 TRINITY_DN888_c0_g1_i2:42-779(-)